MRNENTRKNLLASGRVLGDRTYCFWKFVSLFWWSFTWSMRDEQNEHPNLAGQLIMASTPHYLVHSLATSITIPILASNIWSKFHTSITGYFILFFLWKPNTIWITKIEGILFIFYISWCETGCIYSQWKRLIFFLITFYEIGEKLVWICDLICEIILNFPLYGFHDWLL